jgi:hypothetical protein
MTPIQMAKKIPGSKIAAFTAEGREFVLNHTFAHRDDPKLLATLNKIREAGSINLNHWRPARRGEV